MINPTGNIITAIACNARTFAHVHGHSQSRGTAADFIRANTHGIPWALFLQSMAKSNFM